MHLHRLLVLCAVAAPILSSWGADDPAATPPSAPAGASADAAKAPAAPKIELHYASGTVTIADQLATIELPKDYHYLAAKEARFVVEKVWGNPPDHSVLGLVVPPKQEDVFDWAIVVSYEESGYVKDDDAKSNDYAKILSDMQGAVKEANPERKKAGYPTLDLLGWAESPQYDAATHKIFWAKRLQFDGSKAVTLNYDVRVLGRKGVLVLSAVAEDSQLALVAENSKAVLAKTAFTSGNRYEDFSASSGDKVAEYGIAGLITGAVLLKTGLLKVLIKPLLIGGVLLAGVLSRFFKGRKAPSDPSA
jgi:uncharacterized membrane-anchored protein